MDVQQAITALQVAAAHCSASGVLSEAMGTATITAEEYMALMEEVCQLRSQVASLSATKGSSDGCCPDLEGTGRIHCAATLAEVRDLAAKGIKQGDWLRTRFANLSTQVEQMDLEAAEVSNTISAIVNNPFAHLTGLNEV